jgi:hypothetical protein
LIRFPHLLCLKSKACAIYLCKYSRSCAL